MFSRLPAAALASIGRDDLARRIGPWIGLSVSLLGLPLIVTQNRHGAPSLGHLSYDAFRYLAGAVALLETGTYRDVTGAWSLHFPPGTSLIYAGASWLLGRAPEELVAMVDVTAYLISGLAFGGLAWKVTRSLSASALLAGSVLLNTQIISWHSKLWSEPWALAVTFCAACVLVAALEQRRARFADLLVAALLAGAAVTIRWAMLPVPLVVAASALCFGRPSRRVAGSIACLVVAAVPAAVAVVLTRPAIPLEAWTYTGRYGGQPQFEGLIVLADQILPTQVIAGLPALAFLALLVALPLLAAWALWRWHGLRRWRVSSHLRAGGRLVKRVPAMRVLVALAALTYGYLALVLAAPLINGAAQPTQRILTPVLPLVLVTALLAVGTIRRLGSGNIRRAAALLLVAVLAGLSVETLRNVRSLVAALSSATTSDPSRLSGLSPGAATRALAADAAAWPAGAPIVSNAQGFVWYATRRPIHNVEAIEALLTNGSESAATSLIVLNATAAPALSRFVESHDRATIRARVLAEDLRSVAGVWEVGRIRTAGARRPVAAGTDAPPLPQALPGGNITGLNSISPELDGKRVEILKETVPGVSRVASLWEMPATWPRYEESGFDIAARVRGRRTR